MHHQTLLSICSVFATHLSNTYTQYIRSTYLPCLLLNRAKGQQVTYNHADLCVFIGTLVEHCMYYTTYLCSNSHFRAPIKEKMNPFLHYFRPSCLTYLHLRTDVAWSWSLIIIIILGGWWLPKSFLWKFWGITLYLLQLLTLDKLKP